MIKEVKKIATIHDISGLGRCSLTAAIPILSVLGIQPCPFPTAVLSCQTGYSNFSFFDLTDEMKIYKESWRKMGFHFNGIYTGFLGSEEQIDIVLEFIDSNKDSFIFVDPVMGDGGQIYPVYNKEMCHKMISLVKKAHIVAPNLTEALILLKKDHTNLQLSDNEIITIAKEISNINPDKVVITGVIRDNYIYNYGYDKVSDRSFVIKNPYNGISIDGTGDVFSSVLCGMIINNFDFELSVRKASEFVLHAINETIKCQGDMKNGVVFEPLLKDLLNL